MTKELVYVAGLAKAEQILLESYLDLVELADGRTFGVTDVLENAQVELFDPSTTKMAPAKPHLLPRIAYVAPNNEPGSATDNVLILRRPVSLGNLRDVLGTISKRSGACGVLPIGKSPIPVADFPASEQKPSEHRKLECWLTLLTQVEGETLPREIQGFGSVQIMLFPMQKKVSISDPESWRAKLVGSNRSLIVLPHINQHVPTDGATLSFDRFRWELCMTLSRGLLLPGIAGMARYSLLQWPDFGALGVNADHMKLSALFHARELSIAQAAALSNLPVNTVIAFVNGCAALGLLKNCPQELLGRKVPKPARELSRPLSVMMQPSLQAGGGFGSWIGKIRNAFGLRH